MKYIRLLIFLRIKGIKIKKVKDRYLLKDGTINIYHQFIKEELMDEFYPLIKNTKDTKDYSIILNYFIKHPDEFLRTFRANIIINILNPITRVYNKNMLYNIDENIRLLYTDGSIYFQQLMQNEDKPEWKTLFSTTSNEYVEENKLVQYTNITWYIMQISDKFNLYKKYEKSGLYRYLNNKKWRDK